MACPYCYARRMYKRFKWNPEIRWKPEQLLRLSVVPNGSRLFIGSTIELFHEKTIKHMDFILDCIKRTPHQTSILLTKKPENLARFSPFPDNCWVGVSVTTNGDMTNAYYGLSRVRAGTRFISAEPLLGQLGMDDHVNIREWLEWVIIGSQTQPVKHPNRKWVEEIISAADKASIPVFIKEPLASHYCIQRQEFPK